jgi:hypothetical protein
MLRRDDIAGWHAWKPALIGTPAPVKPSAAPIIVLTIVSCGFLIAVLYLTSHVPRLQPPTALGKALTDKTSSRKETTSPPEPAGAKAAPPQPTSKPESRSTSKVRLIFKDSPLFTKERRQKIGDRLQGFHDYLARVGFDPPLDIPPIEVTPGRHTVVGLFDGSGNPYEGYLRIGELNINEPRGLIFIYANHLFRLLLSGTTFPDEFLKTSTVMLFSTYYTDSYLGQCTSSTYIWANALWEIREKCGKEFMDSVLFYTYKRLEPSHEKVGATFDRVFRNRLMRGLMVRSNLFEIRKDVLDILSKHGLDEK